MGSPCPPMGVTTVSFKRVVEIVEYYQPAKFDDFICDSFRENRGQSSTFDLEYLVTYGKVKVKVTPVDSTRLALPLLQRTRHSSQQFRRYCAAKIFQKS